jgi:spermidine/putrescine transport system permease protein
MTEGGSLSSEEPRQKQGGDSNMSRAASPVAKNDQADASGSAAATVGASGTAHAIRNQRLPGWPVLQAGPACLLFLIFLVAPLAVMVVMSSFKTTIFGIELTPSFANYEKFFSEWMYAGLLLKSLRMAATITLIVLLISFPVAYWLAKLVSMRWKMTLLLLVFAPYWVNYVIRTYAWMPLLGRTGVVNYVLLSLGIIDQPIDALLFNEFSVQLVMVYIFLPFGIIPLYLSIDRIDDNLLRASADLGASPATTFRHVVLPLSAPGLAGAALTVFVLAIGSYVTPRLIGGPSGIMFGNVIADQFGASFNWSWGATLSIMLVIATMLVVALVSTRVSLSRVFLQS